MKKFFAFFALLFLISNTAFASARDFYGGSAPFSAHCDVSSYYPCGSQGWSWGRYHIVPRAGLSDIGFKFEKAGLLGTDEYPNYTYGLGNVCPSFPNGGTGGGDFGGYLFRVDDLPTFSTTYNIDDATSYFSFGKNFGGDTDDPVLQPDGTCTFHLIAQTGTLVEGDYSIFILNPPDTTDTGQGSFGFGDDCNTADSSQCLLSMDGSATPHLFYQTNHTGGVIENNDYNVDDDPYFNKLPLLDFYLTTASVVAGDAVGSSVVSCNPFAPTITTAFLNLSFSIADCTSALFVPSDASLSQFSGLYDLVIHKPPFGYVSAINSALSGINITETAPFTLSTMSTLNTYIFTPIRTGLIWVLWVAFAFILYHRLKDIHL